MGINFFKHMFKPAKSVGNWIKHAAEDTFDFAKHTVKAGVKLGGKVGNRLLNFTDKQVSSVTGVFSSPSFLIIAGVVIVGFVLLKSK
jgi:hypothetical protein